jgi:hypothetical protein
MGLDNLLRLASFPAAMLAGLGAGWLWTKGPNATNRPTRMRAAGERSE